MATAAPPAIHRGAAVTIGTPPPVAALLSEPEPEFPLVALLALEEAALPPLPEVALTVDPPEFVTGELVCFAPPAPSAAGVVVTVPSLLVTRSTSVKPVVSGTGK